MSTSKGVTSKGVKSKGVKNKSSNMMKRPESRVGLQVGCSMSMYDVKKPVPRIKQLALVRLRLKESVAMDSELFE